jgi:hypothetical protein
VTLATLDGNAISRARVSVPAWGLWYADVDLVSPVALARDTRVTLVIADVTLSGTIASGGAYEGRAAYRVVAGAGGWGRVFDARAYANDLGVKASNVIADAARVAGETVEGAPTTRLGPHYARDATRPASQVLHAIAPNAWRVDFDGVTRFGIRASSTYDGDAPRVRVDPAIGVVELAAASLAGLVPGVVIDGRGPASDVEIELTPERLAVRAYYAASPLTRRARALASIFDAIDPRRRYRGTFEFRVLSQSGDRFALQPARAASGMPLLENVPVRPGMAGLRADVQPGELVLVTFADADPSRPCVVAHDSPDSPGWMPLTLELGEAPTLGVARVTDTVQAGAFAGVITSASARIKASL